jgi:cation:H+ antiporter
MDLALWSVVLAASLACLLKASDVFMSAAEKIGLGFGLPPFIIGVTIVAFGTSLPELVSGVLSVLMGAPEIAVGTAIGSNVTNILLILGLAAVVGGGITVAYELVRVDLPFLFGSAFALAIFGYDGRIGPVEGAIGLAALVVYITYAVSTPDSPATTVAFTASKVAPVPARSRAPAGARVWMALLAGGGFIHLGAHFTVASVIEISDRLGFAREILATSVVALGTSLPELAVSARSAASGKPEIAVGNVIGSNIFNALGVVGVAALVGTLDVPASLSGFGMQAMLGVTILCFFVLQEREMTRWDGWLLLVLYAAFLTQLFGIS